ENTAASLKELVADFARAGLGKPNVTKLRTSITKDRRAIKISRDKWQLKSDKIPDVEKKFQLSRCLSVKEVKAIPPPGRYVNKTRLQSLKRKKGGAFDFSRLIQMLIELDHASSLDNCISVGLLVRAILDHVPPIFGANSFAEIANNYNGTKSFKASMLHLENSSRKIADAYLHTKIRNKESLPNRTQVNFSNDLDVLLAEIVRIN
ncbi:MAG: hypothetical protein M3O72_02665, partial [Verrucomicrobiota bacterium]|nr:hypothetical protein [Verrucomicrobiota bacterium]